MTKIRGVLFDAGNTLIRPRTSVGDVYAGVARRYGVSVEEGELEPLFRQAFFGRKRNFIERVSRPHTPERERAWWRGLVTEIFGKAGLLSQLGDRFEAFFDDLYATFERAEVWEVFPDVLPCLDALEPAGLALGVVSNWDSRLHPVLRGLGLATRFRFVLTSAEFGAEKPDPAIFLAGAQRLGLLPQEVVYVGDLYHDDVAGAEAVGMRAILVDRECGHHENHRYVCRLTELLAHVS